MRTNAEAAASRSGAETVPFRGHQPGVVIGDGTPRLSGGDRELATRIGERAEVWG